MTDYVVAVADMDDAEQLFHVVYTRRENDRL
jgi:hypothetical protein